MKHVGYIDLPEHRGDCGFDHADVHLPSGCLYVAIGDPGVIDVIDIGTMRRLEVVQTETGAHTFALDQTRNKIYAFLPQSHRAAVFVDQ
jgi:hypothetical protein